jgi:excisionase family DNA binding protein
MTELPHYLTQTEAANALGVARMVIHRAVKQGKIKPTVIGNKRFYSRASVIDLAIRRNSK